MCYAETFWLNGQAQAHGIKNSLNYSNEFPSNEDVQIQSDEYLYLAAYQRYIVLQCCSAAVLLLPANRQWRAVGAQRWRAYDPSDRQTGHRPVASVQKRPTGALSKLEKRALAVCICKLCLEFQYSDLNRQNVLILEYGRSLRVIKCLLRQLNAHPRHFRNLVEG